MLLTEDPIGMLWWNLKAYIGDVLINIIDRFMPNGLPKFIRRRLPARAPVQLGEATFCVKCAAILQRRKVATRIQYPWNILEDYETLGDDMADPSWSPFQDKRILSILRHYPWDMYRHEDDLTMLERSASARCYICIKLLAWIASVMGRANGSDAPAARVIPREEGSTIGSQLLNCGLSRNRFDLFFTIHRIKLEESEEKYHVLQLQLVPAENKQGTRHCSISGLIAMI